jgi:hypothetical protein
LLDFISVVRSRQKSQQIVTAFRSTRHAEANYCAAASGVAAARCLLLFKQPAPLRESHYYWKENDDGIR